MRKFGVKRGGKGEISSVKKVLKLTYRELALCQCDLLFRGLTFPSSELAYFNGTSACKVWHSEVVLAPNLIASVVVIG